MTHDPQMASSDNYGHGETPENCTCGPSSDTTHDPQMVERCVSAVAAAGKDTRFDLSPRDIVRTVLEASHHAQLVTALDYAHQSEEILLNRARAAETLLIEAERGWTSAATAIGDGPTQASHKQELVSFRQRAEGLLAKIGGGQ